jgi:GT2 family glycosyltransferase
LPQKSFLRRLADNLEGGSDGKVTRSGLNHHVYGSSQREILNVEWLAGCSMSFKRELFEHELFDERRKGNGHGEDVDFCLRALRHGRLTWNSKAKIDHLQSSVNRFALPQLGREVAGHRLMLAADRLHGITQSRVLCRNIGEGLLSIVRGLLRPSSRRMGYGINLIWASLTIAISRSGR